ncbi:MAG: MgtC/SapB family protein [Planctomycetaceae bacterium]|nr:MgtC/SapB family protein [Planctomycetaceae bacterium]
MPEPERLLFEQLGIALSLGALVGLQRERAESVIAGLRTFPLITLFGTVAAALDVSHDAHGWIIAAGFLALVALVAAANLYQLRQPKFDFGMTTEIAVLVMYAVGAYLVMGTRVVGVAVGAIVAVLLQFKPELHGIAARLGDQDVRAIMTFVLITCIVLPVLPNTTYDVVPPLNVLNPFEIWLMVVLMVGIGLSGYLSYKFFGRNAGILLGGLLGGAVSSTATTLSYAKRTRSDHCSVRTSALVIVIASTVSFVRVLIEIFMVAPQHFVMLAPPVAITMGGGVLVAAMAWLRVQQEPAEPPAQKNPTELRFALLFAVLYAGVLMALSATMTYLGGQGLYVIAALSGLTDMDAVTLSTARMVRLGSDSGGLPVVDGWRVIIIASLANLVFKWLMAAAVGGPALWRQLARLFAVPFAVGCLVLLLWPA